jgi:hypothetical protein
VRYDQLSQICLNIWRSACSVCDKLCLHILYLHQKDDLCVSTTDTAWMAARHKAPKKCTAAAAPSSQHFLHPK